MKRKRKPQKITHEQTIKYIDSHGIAQREFGPNWSTIRTVIKQVGCLSMRHNAPLLADDTNTIRPLDTGYVQASAPSVHTPTGVLVPDKEAV